MQDSTSFECNAYLPILKLVGASRSKDMTLPKSLPDDSLQKTFQNLETVLESIDVFLLEEFFKLFFFVAMDLLHLLPFGKMRPIG